MRSLARGPTWARTLPLQATVPPAAQLPLTGKRNSTGLIVALNSLFPYLYNKYNITILCIVGSYSSEESDEEVLDSHHSESHHSSPAKEVATAGLVTFDSLFPSFQQTYGQELQSPSKQDMHLYKR